MSLVEALDVARSEGRGSRVRAELNGRVAVFHRPHPQTETGQPTVRDVRDFLEAAGARPNQGAD